MSDKYIGPKKVKELVETEEKTPGDNKIIKIIYEDDTFEFMSQLMIDRIITPEASDATALRDKRVNPVVEMMLSIVREFGLKSGELPYMATLLNQSLDYNQNQALLKLVGEWLPGTLSLDDVDYLTIDRILKNKK